MSRLPLSDIEAVLAQGWINAETLDISRIIKPGQVVTVVLSDAPFNVPDQVGTANILGSRQHVFEEGGLVKMRVLERR